MATKAEIKAALLEVLTEDLPYSGSDTSGPRKRIHAAGWDDISLAARLDYLFELVAAQDIEPGKPGSLFARLNRVESQLGEVKTQVNLLGGS
jgi:hypothetical protein